MSITNLVRSVLTFRDRMRDTWSPPWLATGNNEKLLYAIAIQADIMADAMVAAIASRFPGLYTEETLPIIGRERRISRGPYETSTAYANRLIRWLSDHPRRGGPYALLEQLHAYYAPANFPIDLMYRNGKRYHLAADGTITRDVVPTFGFDSNPAQWARWWLIYTTDDYPLTILTTDDAADLVHVPHEWNAAHCIGALIVMTPSAELWNWPLGRTWNESGTWDVSGDSVELPVNHA